MPSWIAACLIAASLIAAQAPFGQPRTAAELEKAGWQAVRAGRLLDAASAFGDAMRLDPRSARLMLGAGLSAHLLGRAEEARQLLVAAIEAQPAMTEASLLLGQILYQRGDLDGAIAVYQQARQHAPNEPLLAARIDAWRREADLHGRFTQRLGDHFTVLFEGPKEDTLAAQAIELLEAAYWRVGTALGAYPPGPTTVVLYTQEQFRDITRSPEWAAAAFDGRIRIPMRGAVKNARELERVLSHEFTHALVHSLAPRNVPQWLEEGLAVAFEPGGGEDPSAPHAAKNGGREPSRIALSRLEKSFEGLTTEEARSAYAESAAATRALIELAGMPGILNLLSNLGDGLPFDQAFERAALVSYAEFQRARTADDNR